MSDATLLFSGLAMGESPRWHGERLWVCDWGAQRILVLNEKGILDAEIAGEFGLPFSIDWLPDGRQLIVAGPRNLLLRREHDGTLVEHANLAVVSDRGWNEIVVDGRGRIYVNGGPGVIALVSPEGSVRQVADQIAFPNGMAVTNDNRTLIIAESHGKCLTAFTIAEDGGLSDRRIWAAVDGHPDGICIDAENRVWYADVPNRRCVRLCEGGKVLDTVNLDLGAFACILGGPDRKRLFVVAAEWRGMANMAAVALEKTGRILAVDVLAGSGGRP